MADEHRIKVISDEDIDGALGYDLTKRLDDMDTDLSNAGRYDDGTPLEDLKPGQAGADKTSENTSANTEAVAGLSANELVESVEQSAQAVLAQAEELRAQAQAVADNAQAIADEANIRAAGHAAQAQALADEVIARAAGQAAEQAARAQAIADEGQARANEIAAEASDRAAQIGGMVSALQANIDAVQAQITDIVGAAEYDPLVTYTAGDIVKYDGSLWRAKSPTTGNAPDNGSFWDEVGQYASIGEAVAAHALAISQLTAEAGYLNDALTASVNKTDSLAVQMRGNYNGSDLSQVTNGLLHQERTARATADSAQNAAITSLTNDLAAANTAINLKASASALEALTTTVTGQGNSLTLQGSAITSLQNTLNHPTTGLASRASATALTALESRVTAAEGVNTSQSSSITSLTNGLGQSGSQNLIYNPAYVAG
ncbi:MAG: hypothetical protein QM645_11440, partial [Asticcacaulis sp.]